MSDYPSTSPWGPHGPQAPSQSVTPNPTSPTSFPSGGNSSSYFTPLPSYTFTGGIPADVSTGPRPKSIIFAAVLFLILGPFLTVFGSFYLERGGFRTLIRTALYAIYFIQLCTPNILLTLAWHIAGIVCFFAFLPRIIAYNKQFKYD